MRVHQKEKLLSFRHHFPFDTPLLFNIFIAKTPIRTLL